MPDNVICGKNHDKSSDMESAGLFVLKHKDLDVAMAQMDVMTGALETVVAVYLPEEMPPGIRRDGRNLRDWWKLRGIPDSRAGFRQVLECLDEPTGQSLMLASYGLSLTDHYWMQPLGQELYWKDLNFYDNDFSDDLGNLLTDSAEAGAEDKYEPVKISVYSPASSVNGDMKKKWVIRGGSRYLMKVSTGCYGQQAVNEFIAGMLHKRLGWTNYVTYKVEKVRTADGEAVASLSPLFTSAKLEFVSAYQLLKDHKVPNESSLFHKLIRQAEFWGADADMVRRQLEYTILVDFILSNTDRHLNNMGFLYDSEERRIVIMAPVFDSGNSLFFDREVIPHGDSLLDIRVNSFCKREVDMLRYVEEDMISELNLDKLDGFSDEAYNSLIKFTCMPEQRAREIAETIDEKIEYLRKFSAGKKIWKRVKYW